MDALSLKCAPMVSILIHMGQLIDLNVNFISLVDKGANRKPLVYKSDDGSVRFEFPFRVLKSDDEKGIVYGVVYEPDTVDTQGDWADAVTIERAAHGFMEAGKVRMVDRQHNYDPTEGAVVESFIKNGEARNYPDAKDGAWLVAIKPSEMIKSDIKSGKIAGFSLAGTGSYKEKADNSTSPTAARIYKSSQPARVHKRATIHRAIKSA